MTEWSFCADEPPRHAVAAPQHGDVLRSELVVDDADVEVVEAVRQGEPSAAALRRAAAARAVRGDSTSAYAIAPASVTPEAISPLTNTRRPIPPSR